MRPVQRETVSVNLGKSDWDYRTFPRIGIRLIVCMA